MRGGVKKGGKQACWKIFRPHWVVLIACTICDVSATLDVQLLLLLLYWVAQRCCELHCGTRDYSPRAPLSSFASTAGRPTNPPFLSLATFSRFLPQMGLID